MFVTVAVVMCKIMVATPTIAPDRDCTAEEAKVVEVVTDSELDPNVTWQGCQLGQANLAKWKSENPIYAKQGWRVARVMCAPERKGKAMSISHWGMFFGFYHAEPSIAGYAGGGYHWVYRVCTPEEAEF